MRYRLDLGLSDDDPMDSACMDPDMQIVQCVRFYSQTSSTGRNGEPDPCCWTSCTMERERAHASASESRSHLEIVIDLAEELTCNRWRGESQGHDR